MRKLLRKKLYAELRRSCCRSWSGSSFPRGSQVDVRPIQDFDIYLDKEIEMRIVKFNESRKNIVVSHKIILEDSLKEQREALFKELEIGSIIEGRVKNITDFGVFVDLGWN